MLRLSFCKIVFCVFFYVVMKVLSWREKGHEGGERNRRRKFIFDGHLEHVEFEEFLV